MELDLDLDGTDYPPPSLSRSAVRVKERVRHLKLDAVKRLDLDWERTAPGTPASTTSTLSGSGSFNCLAHSPSFTPIPPPSMEQFADRRPRLASITNLSFPRRMSGSLMSDGMMSIGTPTTPFAFSPAGEPPVGPCKLGPRRDSTPQLITRYAQDFEELGEIGCGAFGKVYRVRNRMDGQQYAVKIFASSLRGQNPEVQGLAVCGSGPNVVRYFSAWADAGQCHLQMEYCEGGSLAAGRGKRWEESDLLDIIMQLATALEHVHDLRVVHLDVKPDNIYVTTRKGKLRPTYLLGDFGMAHSLDGEFGGIDDLEGDSRYLCRSVLSSDRYLQEADVFSLGATIYELARMEELPTSGSEWQSIRDGDLLGIDRYSSEFVSLLQQMMDPQPDRRPSASQLVGLARIVAAASSLSTSCCDVSTETENISTLSFASPKSILSDNTPCRHRSPASPLVDSPESWTSSLGHANNSLGSPHKRDRLSIGSAMLSPAKRERLSEGCHPDSSASWL